LGVSAIMQLNDLVLAGQTFSDRLDESAASVAASRSASDNGGNESEDQSASYLGLTLLKQALWY
jgi:hypothetical protein